MGCLHRRDIPPPRKLRIVPGEGNSSTSLESIKALHNSLRPLFGGVIQDLNPHAPTRFPQADGTYTVQFQGFADQPEIERVIASHGFSILTTVLSSPA